MDPAGEEQATKQMFKQGVTVIWKVLMKPLVFSGIVNELQ